jgi:hypothetical protein
VAYAEQGSRKEVIEHKSGKTKLSRSKLMFVCIENGKLYCTNASEADLRLCAKRNPNFHFESIEYVPCDQVHRRFKHFQPDPEVVKKMARKVSRTSNPVAISDADVESLLEEMFATQDLS